MSTTTHGPWTVTAVVRCDATPGAWATSSSPRKATTPRPTDSGVLSSTLNMGLPPLPPVFYGLVALGTAGGTALSLLRVKPIKLLILVAVINGVAAAPFLIVVMRVSSSWRLMGGYVNGNAATILGWLTAAIMPPQRSSCLPPEESASAGPLHAHGRKGCRPGMRRWRLSGRAGTPFTSSDLC